MNDFRALVLDLKDEKPEMEVRRLQADELPAGEVTIRVAYSSINYKDAVVAIKHAYVKAFPLISSGLAGGADVQTTVYPFILRGISWIGIDSVYCPMPLREKVWSRLGADLKPLRLNEDIVHEISLEQVPDALNDILNGSLLGRTVVNMQE